MMMVALAGAAQEVQVSNLEVADNNVITFEVSWKGSTVSPAGRTERFSDSLWVFIDYFDMDKQQMWRLPVSSAATATPTSASTLISWAGAKVRTITDNNAGFYIERNARGADDDVSYRVKVAVTPAGTYPRGVIRPCVYVTDFRPVATYEMSSDIVTAKLEGTAPYSGQYSGGVAWTSTSSAALDVPSGRSISRFFDATGNEGLIECDNSAKPTVSITPSTDWVRCGAGTVTLEATTPSPNATIDWYADATGGTPLHSGSTTYTTPDITTSTTYYAQARNISTGCVSSSRTEVTATVNDIPNTPTLVNNSGNQCEGTVGVTFKASGGSTYEWSGGGFDGQSGTATSKTTLTTPDTYTVKVRNAKETNGVICRSAYSDPVTAYVNPTPTKPSLTHTGDQCEGIGVTFNATGGKSGSTYEWAGVGFDGKTGGSQTSSTLTGTYIVKVRSAEAANDITCRSEYTTDNTAYVNSLSTIKLTSTAATQNQTVCEGSAIAGTSYTIDGSAASATVANLPAGLTAVLSSKIVRISGTPTASGTYTITTTGHTEPCEAATIEGTVTVRPAFTPGVIASTGQAVCQGATANQISSTTPASGGDQVITYRWLKDNSAISSTNAAAYTPPTTTVGIYSYTRQAHDGTCNTSWATATNAYKLTVNDCTAPSGCPTHTAGRIGGSGSGNNNTCASHTPGRIGASTAGSSCAAHNPGGIGG